MLRVEENILTETERKKVVDWITQNEYLDSFNNTSDNEDTSRAAFSVTFKSTDLPEILNFMKDKRTNIYNMVGIVTHKSGDIPEHVDDDFVWYMKDNDMPGMFIKHPNTTCVYYANVPEDMTGGDTILKYDDIVTVPPKQNSTVEFTSDTPHSVTAMQASGPRVVLVCEKYTLLKPALELLNTPIYRKG